MKHRCPRVNRRRPSLREMREPGECLGRSGQPGGAKNGLVQMGGALDPFKFPLAYDLQKVGVAVAGERERIDEVQYVRTMPVVDEMTPACGNDVASASAAMMRSPVLSGSAVVNE